MRDGVRLGQDLGNGRRLPDRTASERPHDVDGRGGAPVGPDRSPTLVDLEPHPEGMKGDHPFVLQVPHQVTERPRRSPECPRARAADDRAERRGGPVGEADLDPVALVGCGGDLTRCDRELPEAEQLVEAPADSGRHAVARHLPRAHRPGDEVPAIVVTEPAPRLVGDPTQRVDRRLPGNALVPSARDVRPHECLELVEVERAVGKVGGRPSTRRIRGVVLGQQATPCRSRASDDPGGRSTARRRPWSTPCRGGGRRRVAGAGRRAHRGPMGRRRISAR